MGADREAPSSVLLMTTTHIIVLVVAVPLVLWAMRADRRRWATRPRDDLAAMLAADKGGYWKPALKELKRRGEDTSIYLPLLMPRLLADTHRAREAARITLVDQFPELRDPLAGYRAAEDIDVSRGKLARLFEKYGVVEKPG